jgi:hypothetical protein
LPTFALNTAYGCVQLAVGQEAGPHRSRLDQDQPGSRSEVDDQAAALGAHTGQRELAHADQAEHVRVGGLPDKAQRHLFDRPATSMPRIIDQHPDRPALGLDLGFRYTVRQPFGTAVRINSVRTAARPDLLRDLRLAHTR